MPKFVTDPDFCGSQSQEDSRLVTRSITITVVEVSLASHSEASESEAGLSSRASVPSLELGPCDQERLEADL